MYKVIGNYLNYFFDKLRQKMFSYFHLIPYKAINFDFEYRLDAAETIYCNLFAILSLENFVIAFKKMSTNK